MRILIDLQCAQRNNASWSVGGYLLNFVETLLPVANNDGHDVHLLLDGAFAATIPELQRRFPELHKHRRIHLFYGLGDRPITALKTRWRLNASSILRDFAIAVLLPDVVIEPSSASINEASPVSLRALTLSDTPSIVFHHDLISKNSTVDAPTSPAAQAHVDRDIIAVSDTARHNAAKYLNFPADCIRVAPGDAGAQFVPPDGMSLSEMETLRQRYMLMRPYLMTCAMVGVSEPLSVLVNAYTALPRGVIENLDLVVVGTPSERDVSHARDKLKTLSLDPNHIRVVSDVADRDLPGILGLAELFIAPGSKLGYDLPALQAIRTGVLTLGARIDSLIETIGTPETLFQPDNVSDLKSLITRALTERSFCDRMRKQQMHHASRFSWTNSLKKFLSALTKHESEARAEASWPIVQKRVNTLEKKTIELLRSLPKPDEGLGEYDRDDLARALAKTRLSTMDAWRPYTLPKEQLKWRLEGPFDTTYSLAAVNRESAVALQKRGVEAGLFSAEGGGPFDPDPNYLRAHPAIAALHDIGQGADPDTVDVLSRNMFPPRVSDMRGPWNMLHGYAWEETGIPQDFVRDMKSHLQGILVTSPHVEKTFKNMGINIPIQVVGNGVDHLDVPPTALPFDLPQAGFSCLHVSSCFPRKGPDILLKGFAEAFQEGDDVQLIIKTFTNPHNDIAKQISKLRVEYGSLPPITVIEQSLTPSEMRSLYSAADVLIMPSRAEGYCLPIAEALLAGTPVLTTGWGGQKVFSDNPLVQFIDYQYAPAQSHLETWDSVWAEPDLADLTTKLRLLRTEPKASSATRSKAAQKVLSEHSWEQVAERSEDAVRKMVAKDPQLPPKIGWISSYNTRCGIATYSAHLIEHIPDRVTVFASHTNDKISVDAAYVKRCWHQDGHDTLTDLRFEIQRADPEVLVIQFNYGFFNSAQLGALILNEKSARRKVVAMLHSTDDSAVLPVRKLASVLPALAACDLLLVHSHHDLNHLKLLGLEENTSLFPHGVPNTPCPATPAMSQERPIVLGSYGFFLPSKGLNQLIKATALLRENGENVVLHMVNAEFPIRDSADAITTAKQQIKELGLEDVVILETRFLDDADSFERLANCDALVFSYQKTAESASGAIRQALALDRPVITTPLPIFDDVAALVHRLPGTTAHAIFEGLCPIISALRNPDAQPEISSELRAKRSKTKRWRESHAYQVLGPRLWHQICNL